MMSRPLPKLLVLIYFTFAAPHPDRAGAELVDLTFYRREPFANGQSFGDVGPYEKLVGVARFAVHPKNPRNKDIVDLDKAPRNAEGRVEFESDVYILVSKDR